MQIVFVAAIAENYVIGAGGKLPWRLPSDLKHFRQLTLNRPVIMGRKTFASIGKPLDQRTNIVVTRNLSRVADGVTLQPRSTPPSRSLAPTPKSARSTRSW